MKKVYIDLLSKIKNKVEVTKEKGKQVVGEVAFKSKEAWDLLQKLKNKSFSQNFVSSFTPTEEEVSFTFTVRKSDLVCEGVKESEVDSFVSDLSKIVPKEKKKRESSSTTLSKKRKPNSDTFQTYQNLFGVFIGINEYANFFSEQILSGAANDASEMKEFFTSLGFHTLNPLLNKKATKKKIEDLFSRLGKNLEGKSEREREKNKESLVVVFFSGHFYRQDSSLYICASDFHPNNLSSSSFHLLLLRDQFLNFNCKHILFIFDFPNPGKIFGHTPPSPLTQQFVLSNSLHKGIWGIASMEGEKEQNVNGKTSGVFSHHLKNALSTLAHSQSFENFQKLLTPLDLLLLTMQSISSENVEYELQAGSLFDLTSNYKGVPLLTNSKKNYNFKVHPPLSQSWKQGEANQHSKNIFPLKKKSLLEERPSFERKSNKFESLPKRASSLASKRDEFKFTNSSTPVTPPTFIPPTFIPPTFSSSVFPSSLFPSNSNKMETTPFGRNTLALSGGFFSSLNPKSPFISSNISSSPFKTNSSKFPTISSLNSFSPPAKLSLTEGNSKGNGPMLKVGGIEEFGEEKPKKPTAKFDFKKLNVTGGRNPSTIPSNSGGPPSKVSLSATGNLLSFQTGGELSEEDEENNMQVGTLETEPSLPINMVEHTEKLKKHLQVHYNSLSTLFEVQRSQDEKNIESNFFNIYSKREQLPRQISISEIWKEKECLKGANSTLNRVFIKAKKGTGKTTLCKFICKSFAEGKLWNKNFFADFVVLVDLVDAIRYFVNSKKGLINFFEFFFDTQLFHYYTGEEKTQVVSLLQEKERQGKLLWVMDRFETCQSFSEIDSITDSDAFIAKEILKKLQNVEALKNVILTSSSNSAPPLASTFPLKLCIRELTTPQVRFFVQNFFELNPTSGEFKENKTEFFMQELSKNDNLNLASKTLVFLEILCKVFENYINMNKRSPILSPSSKISDMIDVFVGSSFNSNLKVSPLEMSKIKNVLVNVAYNAFIQQMGSISEKELLSFISSTNTGNSSSPQPSKTRLSPSSSISLQANAPNQSQQVSSVRTVELLLESKMMRKTTNLNSKKYEFANPVIHQFLTCSYLFRTLVKVSTNEANELLKNFTKTKRKWLEVTFLPQILCNTFKGQNTHFSNVFNLLFTESISKLDTLKKTSKQIAVCLNECLNGETANLFSSFVEKLCDQSKTELFVSCCKEQTDLSLLKFLLSKNTNLNSRDTKLRSPIFYACKKGNLGMFKFFIENGSSSFFLIPTHFDF